jgi:hypothetical protein
MSRKRCVGARRIVSMVTENIPAFPVKFDTRFIQVISDSADDGAVAIERAASPPSAGFETGF